MSGSFGVCSVVGRQSARRVRRMGGLVEYPHGNDPGVRIPYFYCAPFARPGRRCSARARPFITVIPAQAGSSTSPACRTVGLATRKVKQAEGIEQIEPSPFLLEAHGCRSEKPQAPSDDYRARFASSSGNDAQTSEGAPLFRPTNRVRIPGYGLAYMDSSRFASRNVCWLLRSTAHVYPASELDAFVRAMMGYLRVWS